MAKLIKRYFDMSVPGRILDVGGKNVHSEGTYRDLFDGEYLSYCSVDIEGGEGVDFVLDSPYDFPFGTGDFDLVICGQVFEHVPFFWQLFSEMVRVTAKDGLIFVIAPSAGNVHRYPVDCWRFYPDAYRALADWGKVTLIDSWRDSIEPWRDAVGAFRK